MEKTICIYHSRDLDGWMSAAIVKKWFIENNPDSTNLIYDLNRDNSKDWINKEHWDFEKDHGNNPRLYMLGWDYGNGIPDLSEYNKIIMCDISFPTENLVELTHKYQDNFIWIDHHISAIKEMEGKNVPNGIRNTKFAACELTWQYFYPHQKIPEIVRLLGRYDCFGHKGTDEELEVLQFQYGARQSMTNYKDCYERLQKSILDKHKGIENVIYTIHNKGKAIYEYLCTDAKQTYSKVFPIEFKGIEIGRGKTRLDKSVKFLCVNQERFNPINFGINYHEKGYDGFACFWFKDGKWMFSLYNDNGEVDCSSIAKSLGGGGHKRAAGFVVDDIEVFLANKMI